MKYYRYNGGLAQVPDAKHSISMRFLLGGAREISWADYHNLVRQEEIVTKDSNILQEDGHLFKRRSLEEIQQHSNIERNVEEIKESFAKNRSRNNKRFKAHPEIQQNYRLRRKQQAVDNSVEK